MRKSVKAHGRQKLIEGNFQKGHLVVVIDDVITTGGSTLQAIEAVENAGGRVAFVLVLVDREEGGREAIEKHGHKVVALFTRTDLIGASAGSPSRARLFETLPGKPNCRGVTQSARNCSRNP